MTRTPALLALFAAGLAAAVGCDRKAAAPAPAKPPVVVVDRPVVKDVNPFEDFTGRTEAYRSVDLRPQVTGRLLAVKFADGEYVIEGQKLFEIDPALFAADLQKAKADVENYNAQIKLAEADTARAEIAYQKGVGPVADVDKAKAQKEVAAASLKGAQAQVARAAETLDYCTITAPFTGRLSSRRVDPGNIVRENETVLTTLVVLDPMYVYFDIDERTLLQLRRLLREGKIQSARDAGMLVQIGLADEDGFSYSGPLTFWDNMLDANTGTLRLRAELPNPPLQLGSLPAAVGGAAAFRLEQRHLRLFSPKMFVRVRLPVGRPHPAVLVPEVALGSNQGKKYVYVVGDDNKAQYREVTAGPLVDSMRVIEAGVTPADRVVVSGQQRVKPGTVVAPTDAGKK